MSLVHHIRSLSTLSLIAVILAAPLRADNDVEVSPADRSQDWTQWRGRNRDGKVSNVQWPTTLDGLTTFGPGELNQTTLLAGGYELFLARFGANGDLAWVRRVKEAKRFGELHRLFDTSPRRHKFL